MQPYNVEIFDSGFQLIQHCNSGETNFKYDYLSAVENTIIVPSDPNVKQGNYIRIVNNEREYFGIIKQITKGEQGNTTSVLRYSPFESVFNTDIVFDTTLQNGGDTLEEAIKNYITQYFINNADSSQNIFGLSITTISSTPNWTFYLTPDVEGLNYTIVNLKQGILNPALTKYNICLYTTLNMQRKTIELQIGVMDTNIFHIEADLPSVLKKSIILNETTKDINKLYVYNSANFTDVVVYYKHTDGTFDTTDSDRIVPVIYKLATVSTRTGQTFQQAAEEYALRTFDTESYNNLIEITVLNNDGLVNARNINIGQEVNIVSNNVSYVSMLTGYEIGTTTKLVFGTIRLDLTQVLKKGVNNGN